MELLSERAVDVLPVPRNDKRPLKRQYLAYSRGRSAEAASAAPALLDSR